MGVNRRLDILHPASRVSSGIGQMQFDMAKDDAERHLLLCQLHLALFWAVVNGRLLPGIDGDWLDIETEA